MTSNKEQLGKITDSIPKDKDMIRIGKYWIGKTDIHTVWIEHWKGEGGGFPEHDIERIIDDYFKKNL